MGFRHPGLSYVLSPLVAVQHVWHDGYLWLTPAVATVTAWFIWKQDGREAREAAESGLFAVLIGRMPSGLSTKDSLAPSAAVDVLI